MPKPDIVNVRPREEHREAEEGPVEPLDKVLTDMGHPPDPSLIPKDRHLLLFVHRSDQLWVEPSEHPGYYYVTAVWLPEQADQGGMAKGTKRPVLERMVPYTVRSLGAEDVVSFGKRIESTADRSPRNYNRWLYDSYEEWLEKWLSPEEDD
jgi:hypothetical protein